MIARFRAWVRRTFFEAPPEVVRPMVIDKMEFDAAVRRRKREQLRRAVAVGDIDEVKRLTAECREMQREMAKQ